MRKIFLLLVLPFLFQACVPMKKLVYLQGDELASKAVKQEKYVFKQKDIIYVKIKTRDEKLNELFSENQSNTNLSGGNLYFTGYTVDSEGNIDLPVIGKIRAEGKTAEVLKKDIEDYLLKNFFKNPHDVFVTVKPAGMNITVLGEVGSPGTVTVLKENPNILEAIARAGEIKLTGNRSEIMVIREKTDGTKEVGYIDLTERSALNSPYFYLENNDMIYVKPLPQKTIGTGTTFVNTLSTLMGLTSFVISLYLLTRK